MPRIFISYRRKDTDYETTAIYNVLAAHFGRGDVFMDVDSIPPGEDFVDFLHREVGRADVVLVVIGQDWLIDRQGNRRLESPDDFVRIEIEAALQRRIRVIPLLVKDATMPPGNELPKSIRRLTRLQAFSVRPGRDFQLDLTRLVRVPAPV